MTVSSHKVYIHGRLRGFTKRRIAELANSAAFSLTRRPPSARTIVLGHDTVGSTVSDSGELRLRFRPKVDAAFLSERRFKSLLGASAYDQVDNSAYSSDQIMKHAGLNGAQLRTLALYDVLNPIEDRFGYDDVVAARAVGRLAAAGVGFSRILVAALALERRGSSLSSVRLAEAPWGELVQQFEGSLARLDGQLLLPLQGEDIDAVEAFARAEASEQKGDMASARRWYDLAARLDENDPVIPFNLGNVLDELGRSREAEIAYRQAIVRGPDFADAWFNLGVLQEKAGREDEALSSYERAFAVEPTYADALHNAALLHMRGRRFAAALPLFDKILSIAPSNKAEAKRLAQLCRLELRS